MTIPVVAKGCVCVCVHARVCACVCVCVAGAGKDASILSRVQHIVSVTLKAQRKLTAPQRNRLFQVLDATDARDAKTRI